MSTSILTRDVLEESHTAKSYLSWARGLVAQVKSEPDGLRRIRLREGLTKELMTEALPIGHLASTYFAESEDVRIKLKIGNQNFDAEVSDDRKNASPLSFIEVTLAHEGEDEYLRSLVLHEIGEVSGLGKVTKRGTKKSGLTVEVAREMVSQGDVLSRERDCVSRAIERKLDKDYPADTLLLIGFDDTIAFERRDNTENLQAVLDEFLSRLKSFHTVAIVGLQRGLLIDRRTGNAI
jgi:hypothetical protein